MTHQPKNYDLGCLTATLTLAAFTLFSATILAGTVWIIATVLQKMGIL